MNKQKFYIVLALLFTFLFSTKALASLTFSTSAITGDASSVIDLGSGNTLSLQTTNNGAITTGSGLITLGGNLSVMGTDGITTPYKIRSGAASTTQYFSDESTLAPVLMGVKLFTPTNDYQSGTAVFGEGRLASTLKSHPAAYGGFFSAGIEASATFPDAPIATGLAAQAEQNTASVLNGRIIGLSGNSNIGNGSAETNWGGFFNATVNTTGGTVAQTANVVTSSFVINGTATNIYNFLGKAVGIYGGSATNVAGLVQDQISGGTNNANLILGTTTIPTGNFNLYGISAYPSYLKVTADVVPLTIDTAVGQTANLQSWKVNNSEKASINKDGKFSGTTAKLTGLPVYANNAAALAGGLVAGDLYRTGADPDPVMVVH